MSGIMDIVTAPASAITNSLGLGSVQDLLGSVTGIKGMNMSEDMFNTSLQWEKDKFAKEIELANSAHQREIEDLKKAGLSPLLTGGGNGANVPSVGGVSPLNMNNAGQGLRDLLFSGLSSAMDIKMMGEQIKQMQTNNAYMKMQTALEGLKYNAFKKERGFYGNSANYFDAMVDNAIFDTLIKQKQYGFLEDYGDMEHWLNMLKTGTSSIHDIGSLLKGGGPQITNSLDYPKIEYVNKRTGEISYRRR